MEVNWELVSEIIARICHEATRAYCRTIDDHTQVAWDDAPQWQRDSAIEGVMAHVVAMEGGMEVEPSASHEGWLRLKESEGWIYGKVKNPDKKEHPCMVPYDELPPRERKKDSIFCAIAHAMVRMQW